MADGLRLVINGRLAPADVGAYLADGGPLVPLRTVVEAFGGAVEFLPAAVRTAAPAAVATRRGATLEVTAGEPEAVANGIRATFLPAPELRDGTFLASPRALAAAFRLGFLFDASVPVVYLSNREPVWDGRRVLIDPGHGGSDVGALGSSGLVEKDVTLDVGLRLAQLLQLEGAVPYLTRNTDRMVSLPARAALAATKGAQTLVSIHCNSFVSNTVRGSETYYFESWEGQKLAGVVQQELVTELGLTDRGVKEAADYVLRHAAVPCCLSEMAFISNPEEESLLASPLGRLRAALALFRGLRSFLETSAARFGGRPT